MDTNIQKYLAFLKTVELKSFSKSAKALSYSQSGISRMINDLEKEWNISLLERSKNGVTLTSDGLKILPYVKNVCKEYQKLQMQIDELNGLQSGIIRIGTFSSLATHWLPNIIKKFQKDYPNIEYELLLGDYTEIEKWLLEGRVDCGFLPLPTNPKLEATFLEKDRLLAIIPENHPFADQKYFPVIELCNYPFMLLERGEKAEIAKIFEQHNLTPNVHFTTWDDYAVMSMVESGLGISILPELILKRIPYKILAKELDVPASRDIDFVVKNHKTASVAVKKFMEYLQYRNQK